MFQLTYACSEASERDCACKISVYNNKVVWRTTTHNHMPNEYSLEAKLTMSRLWHAATESDCDIRELVANTMPLVSPTVGLYLPEGERLKASLQAARRAAAKKRAGQPPAKRKPAAGGKKRKAEDNKENSKQLQNATDVKDALQMLAEDLINFDLLQDQQEVSVQCAFL